MSRCRCLRDIVGVPKVVPFEQFDIFQVFTFSGLQNSLSKKIEPCQKIVKSSKGGDSECWDPCKIPRFKLRAKLSDVIDDPVGRQRGQLSRRRWRPGSDGNIFGVLWCCWKYRYVEIKPEKDLKSRKSRNDSETGRVNSIVEWNWIYQDQGVKLWDTCHERISER